MDVQWPTAVLPVLGALFGGAVTAFFNRMFMSRKDKNDVQQQQFTNSTQLLATQSSRRNDFTAAITKSLKKSTPSMDDIHAVMKTGEEYFETLRAMAQAVLDRRVSSSTCDDFVRKITEALEKSIPAYYDALTKLCGKTRIGFDQRFTEANYPNLFKVADQFAPEASERIRRKLSQAS